MESAFSVFVEVTRQNSLHCTAAIERLDADADPLISLEITAREGKTRKGWTEESKMDGRAER